MLTTHFMTYEDSFPISDLQQKDPDARLIVIVHQGLDGFINYFDTTVGKHLAWIAENEETEGRIDKLHTIHVLTDMQPKDVAALSQLQPDTEIFHIMPGKPRETLAQWKTAANLLNNLF